jgi:hypothetical protein
LLLDIQPEPTRLKEYNIYILDYGHVNASHVIQAKDDEDAIRQATQKFLRYFELDILEQGRFVARLRPPS